MSRTARVTLLSAVLLPAIYLFLAIQHGALTNPFWDHCEWTFLLEKARSGTLQASDMWAPHNHSRPLLLRGILLINGLLTDWDIRSEYVYVYAAIYGAFLVQWRVLRRLTSGQIDFRRPVLGLLLSVFVFSPVGHNNHWWSMMLQLDLANLLILLAMTTIAFGPRSWLSNVLAAVLCWLATYTLTNGLIACAACALVSQWANRPVYRPTRRTLFWIVVTAMLFVCYLHGLSEVGSAEKPSLRKVLDFALVYLGAPVAGLLRFPFGSMFDLPRPLGLNRVVGILLLLAVAGAVYAARARVRERRPETLLLGGFGVFAIGSALVTGYGRAAFDDYGVSNANGSRYTIFSSYLIFGLLFLGAGATLPAVGPAPWRRAFRPALATLLVAFGVCCVRSYTKGWLVYRDAHDFDQQLAVAYAVGGEAQLAKIYPVPATASRIRATLEKLRMGPYRGVTATASADLVLLAGHKTNDEFGINGLRVDPRRGHLLFAHPHSQFSIPLAAGRYRLHVRYGIDPAALNHAPLTDGVEFRIHRGDGDVLWSSVVRPATIEADPLGSDLAIDVDMGRGGDLFFETLQLVNSTNDWAFWQDLTITPVVFR